MLDAISISHPAFLNDGLRIVEDESRHNAKSNIQLSLKGFNQLLELSYFYFLYWNDWKYARTLTWFKVYEFKNMLNKLNNAIVLRMLTSMPPRNKNLPRSAKRADNENDKKTMHVPTNALITIWGLTAITNCNRGPRVWPKSKNKYFVIMIAHITTRQILTWAESKA